MLYFITPTGLYSEAYLITEGGIQINTIQPFVNIPVTYNKESIIIDLEVGTYDFTKGKTYYGPVQIESLVLRKITKEKVINIRNSYTMFHIEIEHCTLGGIKFSFNKENLSLKYFFCHIFPYLNSIKEADTKFISQKLLIIELLSNKYNAFNFIENFDNKSNKDYMYYEIIEGRCCCQELQKISFKRFYKYDIRVGRDDYEYEITYITFNNKNKALHQLLELVIKEDAIGEVTMNINKEHSIEYSYCSYRDSCFGPAPHPKEFLYSDEQCYQYKAEFLEKAKNKYKEILMQFINSFQTFIAKQKQDIYEQRKK